MSFQPNTTRPQLYLVGVPKAGTSALGKFLAEHPQICLFEGKESNYHCRDFNLPRPETEQDYLSLFSVTDETKILADATVINFYSQQAATEIANYTPDARIIVVLRNPVEAMYSWHSEMVFSGNEPLDFEGAIKAEEQRKSGQLLPQTTTIARCPQLLFYRDIYSYSQQLQRYFDRFDRDRVLILFYDDFKSSPESVYQKILDFLELDRSFVPQFRKVNSPKARRNLRLHQWLKKYFAVPARLLLSYKLRAKLLRQYDKLNSQKVQRSSLDEKFVSELKAECKPDLLLLEQMLERKLTDWYL